jgi:hypothetical protein
MPRLGLEVAIWLPIGEHPVLPAARSASLTADALAKRLERGVKIDAMLASPFGDAEVPGLLAGAADKPKTPPNLNFAPERAPLPAVWVVIFVAHDRCDPFLIVQQSPLRLCYLP